MSTTNYVSAALTAEDATALHASLEAIRNKLPFLHGLSTEERRNLARLGDKSVPFVERAVQVATANPTVLPASFDLAEFQRDWALVQSMQPFLTEFTQLNELIEDTKAALGSDLYTEALAVYSYLKVSGQDTGLDDLKATLSRRFKRSTAAPAAATPPAA